MKVPRTEKRKHWLILIIELGLHSHGKVIKAIQLNLKKTEGPTLFSSSTTEDIKKRCYIMRVR